MHRDRSDPEEGKGIMLLGMMEAYGALPYRALTLSPDLSAQGTLNYRRLNAVSVGAMGKARRSACVQAMTVTGTARAMANAHALSMKSSHIRRGRASDRVSRFRNCSE